MRKIILLRIAGLAVLFGWACLSSFEVQAQNNRAGARGSRPGSDGSATLNRAGLKVGMKIPAIKIFDDKGKELSTTALKGKYTVLTFGCLT